MLSMYMVCMLHTLGCGGILGNTIDAPIKHGIAWGFETAAFCAVNCFALISGYVGVKSKFKYRNLLRIWQQAFFYSVGFALLFFFIKPETVGLKGLVKSFFPICTNEYWYLTSYALMYFSIPLMNFVLEKWDFKLIKCFIWTFFAIFSLCSLLPVIAGISRLISGGYSAVWLAYLYLIGGFIRLHGVHELFSFTTESKFSLALNSFVQSAFGNQNRRFAVYALCILVAFCIRTIGHYMVISLLDGHDPFCRQFVSYNSPLILMSGIVLLEFFAHLKLSSRWSAFIRFASPMAFGVYLIHCQRQVGEYLIRNAFVSCANLSVYALPFAIVGIPLAIYVTCSTIDYIRLRIFRIVGLF